MGADPTAGRDTLNTSNNVNGLLRTTALGIASLGRIFVAALAANACRQAVAALSELQLKKLGVSHCGLVSFAVHGC